MQKLKKMTNSIAPIKEPQRLYIGQTLFMVTISKVTKNTASFAGSVIGSQIQFAAIKDLKIRTLELNEGETGLIVNKGNENSVRVSFDTGSLPQEGDGSLFDEEKKAAVVAKSINVVNMEKIGAMEEELRGAKSFLQQLVEKGA